MGRGQKNFHLFYILEKFFSDAFFFTTLLRRDFMKREKKEKERNKCQVIFYGHYT